MRVSYTPRYYADIGEGHVFPIRKFELVRDRLLNEGTLHPADIIEPQPASVSDVLLVHTEDYITRLRAGALTPRELRRLGLPWSKALVRLLLPSRCAFAGNSCIFSKLDDTPHFQVHVLNTRRAFPRLDYLRVHHFSEHVEIA